MAIENTPKSAHLNLSMIGLWRSITIPDEKRHSSQNKVYFHTSGDTRSRQTGIIYIIF